MNGNFCHLIHIKTDIQEMEHILKTSLVMYLEEMGSH